MRKDNIMNYKLIIYFVNIMLCIFALSGIHYEKFIKKNKVWETRILVLILVFVLAYLLTNFIFDFLEWSQIV